MSILSHQLLSAAAVLSETEMHCLLTQCMHYQSCLFQSEHTSCHQTEHYLIHMHVHPVHTEMKTGVGVVRREGGRGRGEGR